MATGGSAAKETVFEARARFFAINGFGADGGYDDVWADAQLGPFAYRVRNLPARARALRTHDLHHLVTGYPTDWRGEAQISAWELGGGLGRPGYAWIIALFGLLTGLLAIPGATWRAFLRGRRSANLYDETNVDAWLTRPLAALKNALHVPPSDARPRARLTDALAFAALAVVAAAFGVLASPVLAALVAHGELSRSWPAACPLACHV